MHRALCKVGSRLSRCSNPSLDTCQYCGRPFCAAHTFFREGHDAVCTSKGCQRKQQDLQAHHGYRARVLQRNAVGLCGVEECEPHPWLECSLCQGHFCERHVSERLYPFREGLVRIDRPVSLCEWCWARRKVWRR